MSEVATIDQNPPAEQPKDMLGVIAVAAADPNCDIEKMRALLDMRKELESEVAKKEFFSAMARVQNKMPTISKNKYNEQTTSHYADMAHINQQIVPVYSADGFALSFGEVAPTSEGNVRIHCRVSHCAGWSEDYYYEVVVDNVGIKGNVNKTMVHGKASSTKYAQRYITSMIFNLAVGDDDDGNAAGQARDYKRINEDQLSSINKMIENHGLAEEFDDWLGRNSLEERADIPAANYGAAINQINGLRKAKNADLQS